MPLDPPPGAPLLDPKATLTPPETTTLVWWKDAAGKYVFVNTPAQQFIPVTLRKSGPHVLDDSHCFETGVCSQIRQLEQNAIKTGGTTEAIVRFYNVPQGTTFGASLKLYWWHLSATKWNHAESGGDGVVLRAVDAEPIISLFSKSARSSTYSQKREPFFRHAILEKLAATRDPHSELFRPTAPEFEYVHDLDGRFLRMSESLSALLGIPNEAVNALTIFDLVDSKHHAYLNKSVKNSFANVRQNKPVRYRVNQNLTPLTWIFVEATVYREKNSGYVVGKAWSLENASLDLVYRQDRILRGSGIAAWDRDLDSMEFYVSREWKQLFGFRESEQPTYREFLSLIHPDDRLRVEKEMQDHVAGRRNIYSTRYRIKSRNGHERWMHASGRISRDVKTQRRYVSGCNVDVTEEMNQSRQLADRERLFSAIFNADPAFIFLKDSERRFRIINQALANFYGTSPENAVGKLDSWFFRNTPHSSQVHKQLKEFAIADEKLLADGQPIHLLEEISPPNSDGRSSRWYKTFKQIIYFNDEPHILGISSDVTQLRLDRDMYEALMDMSPAASFVKSETGQYITVNRKFLELVGEKDKRRVYGKTASDFFSVRTASEIAVADQEALSGHPEDQVKRVLITASGAERHVVGSKRNLRVISEGKIVDGLIGCDIDETSVRNRIADETLTTYHHALKSLGGSFLQNVHSLVRVIRGASEKGKLSPEPLAAAQLVFRSAIYMSGLQSVLKDWRGLAADDVGYSTFRNLWNSCLEDRMLYYRDYIELCSKAFQVNNRLNEPWAESKVAVSGAMLIGILDILVVNAVEHGGPEIGVDVSESDIQSGYGIKITVWDNGGGFPPEVSERINGPHVETSELLVHRFGLKAARSACNAVGLCLLVRNNKISGRAEAIVQLQCRDK